MIKNAAGRWVREEPGAQGPNRAFGGYYRSADRMVDGKLLRGVPLQTTQDAVVAAVQLGYRVVDAQIDRGMRAAQRLRGAAEQQGSGDPAQMLDAGERLASKAMVAGLHWLENAAAEPGSPIKRLLSAEYDIVGSLLGLKARQAAAGAKRRKSARKAEGPDSGGPAAPMQPAAVRQPVKIVHAPDSAKRAVRVRHWELPPASLAGELPVTFYRLDATAPDKLEGQVSFVGSRGQLRVATREDQHGGRWRASVCAPDGEQLGVIEIDL
jgi:hypothetical protein